MAKALKLVGYNTVIKKEVPEFADIVRVEDQDFIPWLAEHDAVWVHADDNAKREHRKLIIAKNIRTLWIYRRGGKMSTREQLRILSYVLPMVLDDFEKRPRHRHYRAFVLGEPPRTRPRYKEYVL